METCPKSLAGKKVAVHLMLCQLRSIDLSDSSLQLVFGSDALTKARAHINEQAANLEQRLRELGGAPRPTALARRRVNDQLAKAS